VIHASRTISHDSKDLQRGARPREARRPRQRTGDRHRDPLDQRIASEASAAPKFRGRLFLLFLKARNLCRASMRGHGIFKKKGKDSEQNEPNRVQKLVDAYKKGNADLNRSIDFLDRVRTVQARRDIVTVLLKSVAGSLQEMTGEKTLVKHAKRVATVLSRYAEEVKDFKGPDETFMALTDKHSILQKLDAVLAEE
jgi:hypothetical protein